jgi:hypothetical protein
MVQFCLRRAAHLAVAFALLLPLVSPSAKAQEARERSTRDDAPTIFDVRKSLPMEPTEKPYHDFYINAGSEAGFKRGQYLPIRRSLPVHDPIQNKQQAVLTVPVGSLLVIHVDRGLTVARLVQELGNEDRPTLEFEAIMIGDHVDVKGITTSPPKDAGPKKSSQNVIKSTEVATTDGEEGGEASGASAVFASPSAASAASSQPETAQTEAAASAATSVQTLPAPQKVDAGGLKTDAAGPKVESQRVTQPLPPPTA